MSDYDQVNVGTKSTRMKTFDMDPDAGLDFQRDWSRWLIGTDTIDSSTWTVEDGISVGDGSTEVNGKILPAPTFTNTTCTVWLYGGQAGQTYEVTNSITTVGLRSDDRTWKVRVRER